MELQYCLSSADYGGVGKIEGEGSLVSRTPLALVSTCRLEAHGKWAGVAAAPGKNTQTKDSLDTESWFPRASVHASSIPTAASCRRSASSSESCLSG